MFNAHYLAFVDDVMDRWMRGSEIAHLWVTEWDVMLKRAVVEWHSPARWPETLLVEPQVTRWGHTSFDARFGLRVGERPVADIDITYVSVSARTGVPVSTPEPVRSALGTVAS